MDPNSHRTATRVYSAGLKTLAPLAPVGGYCLLLHRVRWTSRTYLEVVIRSERLVKLRTR